MTLSPEAIARHDLLSFCRLMEPGFKTPAHIRLLAGKLEAVATGKTKRLIINLPPRHGKSWLISRFFPAWYMGKFPGHQLLNCTHGGDLSTDFGRDIRDLIEEDDFQRVFPGVQCKQDSKAANRFHITKAGTRERGIFKALTRTGKKSGRGANLLLIDDLLDEMEIYSQAAKEQAKRAVRGLRTRLMPEGAIVLIMSRCADDDPVGFVLSDLKHEGWEVLTLPAFAVSDERHMLPDGTVWARAAGDALWPEQWPAEALAALRDGMPLHEWSAKFQQQPIPLGQRLVEEEWFRDRRYDCATADILRDAVRITLSADTSKGTATGARTAIGVWAETRRGAYLLHVAAERWQVPIILEQLKALAGLHKPHSVLIEDKSTGEAIIQLLRNDERWTWPIAAIIPPPGMDKIVRFAASTPAMRESQVWLPARGHPEAKWLPKFEAELFAYPNTPERDQGDMVSQFLNWRRENPLPDSSKAWGTLLSRFKDLGQAFDDERHGSI